MTPTQQNIFNKLPRVLTYSVIIWAGFFLGLEESLAIAYTKKLNSFPLTISDNSSKTHPPQRMKVLTSNSSKDREYTFSGGNSGDYPLKYRVEVYGNSEKLMRLVKQIEPTAFRKGKVIQAGIFDQQQRAEEQVLRLTSQGIWARIVIINPSTKSK
jgi:hypothetical protein